MRCRVRVPASTLAVVIPRDRNCIVLGVNETKSKINKMTFYETKKNLVHSKEKCLTIFANVSAGCCDLRRRDFVFLSCLGSVIYVKMKGKS